MTSVTAGRSPLPVGRFVLGLLVVAAGAVWLLDSLDVIEISWTIFFPIALIITGIGVLVASPGHTEGGLIGMGVVLSVLTVATALSPLDVFRGGVGDRNFAPTSAADLEEEYVLGIGDMELDLRALEVSEGHIERQGERGDGSIAGAGTRRCQCGSHRFGGARTGSNVRGGPRRIWTEPGDQDRCPRLPGDNRVGGVCGYGRGGGELVNLGSLIAGMVFIILGVLFLLDNLGVFEVSFAVVWPIVLIGIGLALLLGGLGRRRQDTPPID